MQQQITDTSNTPTITVEGKQFGRGKALFPAWQMTVPGDWIGEDGVARVSLRSFIAHVVRGEVAAYRERQQERSVVRALTAEQIAAGAERGKIDAGGRTEEAQPITDEEAVAAAILGFEDGLYYVFIGDDQQENLDGDLLLRPGARVTFLRLVALAGG